MAATKINKPAQFYYNYFQVEMDHPVLSTVKPELYSMDGLDMSTSVLIPRDSVSPEWNQRLSDEASTGIPSTGRLHECVMFGPNFGSGNEIVPLSEFPDKSIMVGRITNSCIIHPEHLPPQLAERLRLKGTRLHRCARIGWFPVPKAAAAANENNSVEVERYLKELEDPAYTTLVATDKAVSSIYSALTGKKEEQKEVECPVMQAYIHGDKWCINAINDDGKTERIEIGFVRDESVVPDFSPVQPVAAAATEPVEAPVTIPVPVRVDIDVDPGQPSAPTEVYERNDLVPMPADVSDVDRVRILEAALAKMELIISGQAATKDLLVSKGFSRGKSDYHSADLDVRRPEAVEDDVPDVLPPPLIDTTAEEEEDDDSLVPPLDDDEDDDGSMLPDAALKLRDDVPLGHLYLDEVGWWCVNVRTAPCGVKHSSQFPGEVITLKISEADDEPIGFGRHNKMHVYGGPIEDECERAKKRVETAFAKAKAAESGQFSYKDSLNNKWAFVVNPPSPPAPAPAAAAEKVLPAEGGCLGEMKKDLKKMKPTMFRCISANDQGYAPDVSVATVLHATGNAIPESVDTIRLNMALCQAIPATPLAQLDGVTFMSIVNGVHYVSPAIWETVLAPFCRQFAKGPKENILDTLRRENGSIQTLCKALRNIWYMSRGDDGRVLSTIELINNVIYCDMDPAVRD